MSNSRHLFKILSPGISHFQQLISIVTFEGEPGK